MKFITFKNNTKLPVLIGTWVSTGINGLSTFVEITVKELEEVILWETDNNKPIKNVSLTGEWIINSLFSVRDPECQIWEKEGYRQIEYIGKFRSESCLSGNNTWINNDLFELNYLKNENTVIFITKNT